jgi:Tol biopolymer transport system component
MKCISRFPRWGAVLAVLLFAGFDVPDAAAAARVVPTHEDIWLMKRVGPPQVSPDGRWIVVQVAEPSYDENNQLSDLWLIDTSARNSSRRLTSTRRPESGVVWSPDSRRIVFSAQRDSDEVPQLYSLDLSAGGEAQRLTSLSGGARAPVFSHDGRQLAFVAIMYPRAADEDSNKAMLAADRARKSNARIYDGFPIRNWDHWIDEKQVRIFVQALDEEGQPSGAPRDLLAGTRLAASPGFAGRQTDTGEEIEVEFTPDNKAIVFAATTNLDQAARAFTDSQLFVVDVTGGEPRAITTGQDSWSWPQFTPDGRTLLALVEQQGDNVYNAARLAAFPWPALGEPRIVTHGIDRSVNSYAVAPDSRTVYFTAEDAGSEKLFSVRLGGGTVQTLFGI